MAYVVHQYCNECCNTTLHVNNKCSECKSREQRQKLAAWQSLTVEEKLLDIHKRLSYLERKPPIY